MVLNIFVITGSLYTVSLLKRLARLDNSEDNFQILLHLQILKENFIR